MGRKKFKRRRPKSKTIKPITYKMLKISSLWFLYFNSQKRLKFKMINYLYKRIGCRVLGISEEDLKLNYERAIDLTKKGLL